MERGGRAAGGERPPRGGVEERRPLHLLRGSRTEGALARAGRQTTRRVGAGGRGELREGGRARGMGGGRAGVAAAPPGPASRGRAAVNLSPST